jgi:hypothetical protein
LRITLATAAIEAGVAFSPASAMIVRVTLSRSSPEKIQSQYTKAKPREDGSTPPVDLAIPVFGYQNHISLDRGFGFIRKNI